MGTEGVEDNEGLEFWSICGGEKGGKKVRGGCTTFRVYEEVKRNDVENISQRVVMGRMREIQNWRLGE